MRKICWSPGLRPGPRWGSLQRSPRPTSWWGGDPRGLCCPSPRTPLTILSLCLSCVYVHTCMKMHCYFLLNVKHGASHLYLGGASNYLAPALNSTASRSLLDHTPADSVGNKSRTSRTKQWSSSVDLVEEFGRSVWSS